MQKQLRIHLSSIQLERSHGFQTLPYFGISGNLQTLLMSIQLSTHSDLLFSALGFSNKSSPGDLNVQSSYMGIYGYSVFVMRGE